MLFQLQQVQFYTLSNNMIFQASEAQAIASSIQLACNKMQENHWEREIPLKFSAELSPENVFQTSFTPEFPVVSLLATHSSSFHFCSNLIFRLDTFILFLDTSLVSLDNSYIFLFVTKPLKLLEGTSPLPASGARIFYPRTTSLGNYPILLISDT